MSYRGLTPGKGAQAPGGGPGDYDAANAPGADANDGFDPWAGGTGGVDGVTLELEADLIFRFARGFPGWGPDTVLDTSFELLAALGHRLELEAARIKQAQTRQSMGADHLTPHNDGPGNAAYQEMQERLAEVQQRERAARGG
jgi:hypothetical protein